MTLEQLTPWDRDQIAYECWWRDLMFRRNDHRRMEAKAAKAAKRAPRRLPRWSELPEGERWTAADVDRHEAMLRREFFGWPLEAGLRTCARIRVLLVTPDCPIASGGHPCCVPRRAGDPYCPTHRRQAEHDEGRERC